VNPRLPFVASELFYCARCFCNNRADALVRLQCLCHSCVCNASKDVYGDFSGRPCEANAKVRTGAVRRLGAMHKLLAPVFAIRRPVPGFRAQGVVAFPGLLYIITGKEIAHE
jgi:hypothetical protein